jgi:hypothetical protein
MSVTNLFCGTVGPFGRGPIGHSIATKFEQSNLGLRKGCKTANPPTFSQAVALANEWA